jgi:pimeloyl-ACP methyl ester carboxylesterase
LLHGKDSKEGGDSTKIAKRLSDIIRSVGSSLTDKVSETSKKISSQHVSLRSRLHEDISHARLRLRQSVVATTAHIFNEPLRALFHAQCALLIGDAFAYFSSRGDDRTPAPIAQRIIDVLKEAAALAEKQGEELIVIGHSMGGVILCDVVSCYGKDIPIDVLITVGSQFPLFADLGMYPALNGVPHPIPKPPHVKQWLNIFDPHDFLGYPASHLFSGIDDFHLPTYAVGASAHANYFNRRSFYFHLARRMVQYLPPAAVPTK